MAVLIRGATAICSCLVKDADEALTDPDTSMTAQIVDSLGNIKVAYTAMTKDSTGTYHYDYNSSETGATGTFTVFYKAIDGTRTSKEKEIFTLE